MVRQIDVAVNAPEAGVIKEFLANEEDTVTVGQDLVRIELGGQPSGDKPPATESKDEKGAPKETPKEPESTPDEAKNPEPKPQETSQAAPPASRGQEAGVPKQRAAEPPKEVESPATLGNREERRVYRFFNRHFPCHGHRADRLCRSR